MALPFPVEKLHPREAVLKGPAERASLRIPLEPFRLQNLDVSTAIILEGLKLPTMDFRALSSSRLLFPVNPENGYVDGSVYIQHAHHPADLTAIDFGIAAADGIPAHLHLNLLFSFEGLMNYSDTTCELVVQVRHAAG